MNKTMKVLMFCLVLFLPLPSYAAVINTDIPVGEDKDLVGSAITSCFHPTASYSSIDVPDSIPYEGTTGTVRFRGGFTGNLYSMNFTIYTRHNNGQTQLRIEPGSDSAPFPPNPACRMRDWFSI